MSAASEGKKSRVSIPNRRINCESEIHVVWIEIEPEKDRYDFTVIKAALKIAGDDGKKLMIHFQDRVFNRKVNPYLPRYMESSEYEGGWFYDGNKSLGRAWLPAYRERWIKMLRRLGEEVDAHPNLAGVMLSESSGLFSTYTKRDRAWTIFDAIKVINAEKGRINTTPPTNILDR